MKKLPSLLGTALFTLLFIAMAARLEAKPIPQVRIDVQFAQIASPGNLPDSLTGSGSVGQIYTIGRDDVTVSQYTTFLNAVARKDPYGLYTIGMATDLNIAGILRTGRVGGPYTYSVIGDGRNPIAMVSWLDAARFCNWLDNGQPLAPEGPGTTETGAYTLHGDTTMGLEMKNPGATYSLPMLNQWYKAAYYNPNSSTYDMWTTGTDTQSPGNLSTSASDAANIVVSGDYSVTQSDSFSAIQNYLTPVGFFHHSRSPFGCEDMGGDVAQWTDTTNPLTSNTTRFIPGGGWDHDASYTKAQMTYLDANPAMNYVDVGFRVVSTAVPISYGDYGGITDGSNGILFTTVEKSGLFSSSFTTGRIDYLFTGQLTPQLTYNHTYTAHNQTLGVNYTMGVDSIVGNLVLDGTGNFNVTARRDPYTLKGYPSPDAGLYNFAITSDTNLLSALNYYGIAKMKITPQGLTNLVGEFSDGVGFSAGSIQTDWGQIPTYISPLSNGTDGMAGCLGIGCGCLSGRLLLNPQTLTAEDVYGVGSLYTPPPPMVRVLNFQDVIGNGVFEAYGPGSNYLTGAYLTLTANNLALPLDNGPGAPSFKIYPVDGWMTGQFWDSPFNQYVEFSGYALQKQNIGIGIIQPGSESGYFQIYPNPQFGAGTADYGLDGIKSLPKLTITSPSNNYTIDASLHPSINFAGTASAKDGIGSISYQVLYNGYASNAVTATGSNNWSFDYTFTPGATGVYYMYLKATDVDGNESEPKPWKINYIGF